MASGLKFHPQTEGIAVFGFTLTAVFQFILASINLYFASLRSFIRSAFIDFPRILEPTTCFRRRYTTYFSPWECNTEHEIRRASRLLKTYTKKGFKLQIIKETHMYEKVLILQSVWPWSIHVRVSFSLQLLSATVVPWTSFIALREVR